MHALQPGILYHISVEMIHIPGVTLVYGHSLLCAGMQKIEVLPHETSRHTDENSTNQALHSNTFYYCKSNSGSEQTRIPEKFIKQNSMCESDRVAY